MAFSHHIDDAFDGRFHYHVLVWHTQRQMSVCRLHLSLTMDKFENVVFCSTNLERLHTRENL